jgi:TonB-dependent receptor
MILSLAAVGHSQSADTGTITGRVANLATGQYLQNAIVTVSGTGQYAVSEFGGTYTLPNVPVGDVKIDVTYTGLDTDSATVKVVAGQSATHDFGLTSKDYAKEVVELGQFVVTSAKEGNAKAIMEQMTAINPIKVLAADSMGNVTEGNIGEFLKLMPGVQINYVEADPRQVRVRGLDAKYSTVSLDGMSVAMSGSSNIGTGRGFEFEQLSISSVDRVDLSKDPSPDQPSTVVGTVNLKTKGAFDRKGMYIGYNAAISTNSYFAALDKTQGWDNTWHYKLLPNYSLDYSNVVLNGKLGIQAGFSRNWTIAAQKAVWLYYGNNDADLTNNKSEILMINRVMYQDGPKPTKRDNLDLRFDYMISPDLRVFLRYGFNNYDARFYNHSLDFLPITYAPGYTKTSQTVTNGQILDDSNQYMQKKGQTVVLSGGASYKKGNFSVDYVAQFSHSASWYENRSLGHFSDFAAVLGSQTIGATNPLTGAVNNISWRMDRSSPTSDELYFTQLSGPSWSNPGNYQFVDWRNPGLYTGQNVSTTALRIGWYERNGHDKIWGNRLDFRHDFQSGIGPITLKYGGMSNMENRVIHNTGMLTTTLVGADGVAGTADDNPSNFIDTSYITKWGHGGNADNLVPELSPWKLYGLYKSNPNYYADDWQTALAQHLSGNWDFKETINAVYAQAIFKFGKLDVSPGIRWEGTKDWGEGANILGDKDAASKAGLDPNDPRGVTYWKTVSAWTVAKYSGTLTANSTYGNYVNYLYTTYNFNKDLRLRLSYHSAITRADIANLVPGISNVNESAQSFSSNNTNLKPEKSDNYSLGLEYYFQPVGMFTASAFYSKVTDRQATFSTPLGSTGYLGDTYYANYTMNRTENVGVPVSYSGLEFDYSEQLSFLPGALKGLGVSANYTVVRYSDWAFFTGSPLQMANASLSYSIGKFYARINGNWLGKILNTAGRAYSLTTGLWTPAAPYANEFQASRLQTDLNLEYRLKPRMTLFCSVRNMLNEPSVYTYRDNKDDWERILKTGAVWMVGVKGSF